MARMSQGPCALLLSLLCCLWTATAVAQSRGVVEVADAEKRPTVLYRESHALLIGVGSYSAGWPNLDSIPHEMTRLARMLESQGFHVVTHQDPDSRALRQAFEDFIGSYGLEPENRLLFFFSGHGYTLRDPWGRERGFIVPADTPDPRDDEHGFLRHAVSMDQIMTWARRIVSKHALFMFDSCFSGSVFQARNLPELPPHISDLTREPVRQFITAGKADETVPAQSVFLPAIVDAIEHRLGDLDKDGFVTGVELGMYLRRKVPQHVEQTPQFGKIRDYELSRGDFVFHVAAPARLAKDEAAGSALLVTVDRPASVYVRGKLAGKAGPDNPLSLRGLAPGDAEVRVEAPGYASQTSQVRLTGAQSARLDMALARADAAGNGPTGQGHIRVGDPVLSEWQGEGCLYPATVLEITGHEILVRYAFSAEERVQASRVFPLRHPSDDNLDLNTRVFVKVGSESDRWAPGKIAEKRDGEFLVRLDKGHTCRGEKYHAWATVQHIIVDRSTGRGAPL